jgi:Xaa-Pro aminopeptidase
MPTKTILLAGVPITNQTLYHRIRFVVGDSAAFIEQVDEDSRRQSTLLVRDIEMDRARKHARADRIACAADFKPEGGLSGDRDTALAQAVAECLRQSGVRTVTTDRTLPYIFAHHVQQAGITIEYDGELGVIQRRVKDDEQIAALLRAQTMTQETMIMACQLIARASCGRDGILQHDGDVLTSERVRRTITRYLIDRGYSTPHDSIVVTVPHVADCHHFGTGPLKTGLPVVVDIFPFDEQTRYWGDCTRTVVHGEPSVEVRRMHAAVVAAKQTGIAALRPGVTGEQVHHAVAEVIQQHGFAMSRGSTRDDDDAPSMRHGTGHGIGLDVHEPILLDDGAGEILKGEVFTVEPGLYSKRFGGVRVEDMVAVTDTGSEILAPFHEGLDWL